MNNSNRALFLPSLLDRLTNEDPINQLISEVEPKVSQLKQELHKITNMPIDSNGSGGNKQKERVHQLRHQLIELEAQYNTLKTSIISKQDIQSCVKRDLEWLFNATQYVPNEELNDLPETARSVINFGIPDLAGKTASGLDIMQLERLLFQAIIEFEPRIIKKTLIVRVIPDQGKKEHNIFVFEIEGEIWAQPLPLHLRLRTELELESNQVTIYDMH